MKLFVGILIIITSLLNSILASNFKRINYIYGLICYVLMGLVSYQNHIYGMFNNLTIHLEFSKVQGTWDSNETFNPST